MKKMSHIKTSFTYIRRAPFQAFAAISVLSITFFVATLMVVLVYATQQVLNYFETRPQVIAFLKDDASEGQINELKTKLEGDSRIKDVVYVSKEDALEIYKRATSDNPLLGELVSPSIFPASLEFSVANLDYTEGVISEMKDEGVVDSVSFTANVGGESSLADVINRLREITYYLRIGGIVIVSVLAATSVLVLMVVIGMRITIKRKEIESLSLIGASGWFIRAPIVLEAVNYAIFGAVFGWLMAAVLLMYATPSIVNYFGDIAVIPRDNLTFFALLGIILGVELLVAVIIALLGSMVAVTRALRVIK
jgi:cell division transport system permease protein